MKRLKSLVGNGLGLGLGIGVGLVFLVLCIVVVVSLFMFFWSGAVRVGDYVHESKEEKAIRFLDRDRAEARYKEVQGKCEAGALDLDILYYSIIKTSWGAQICEIILPIGVVIVIDFGDLE